MQKLGGATESTANVRHAEFDANVRHIFPEYARFDALDWSALLGDRSPSPGGGPRVRASSAAGDVRVRVGELMSEEEFAEHRRRNPSVRLVSAPPRPA